MVITLTGENSFLLQRELRKIVDEFVAEHGELALERLDGEEADFVRMQEALTSLPFLANKKMVVLRNPGTNKQFAEEAEKLLSDVPETIDVIIVEPKLDKRLSYYKYLKKSTDFREFSALDINGLAKWLVDTAADQDAPGSSLSISEARYLVERVGADQQLLASELEKLLVFAASHSERSEESKSDRSFTDVQDDTREKPRITRQAIDLLTEPTPQSTIFQLLEAAFAGNRKRALELYAEQRALKVEPPQIIAMLTWQLHVLAIIKTAGERSPSDIAKEARLSPFVVQKSSNIARKLTLQELRTKIQELLRIDVRTKRENIDPDEALQHYLLTLTQ